MNNGNGDSGKPASLTATSVISIIGRSPTILIAEDDDQMRFILSRVFTNDGYTVKEAKDGSDLLYQLCHAHRSRTLPDLIISDIKMPELTGTEVMTRVRAWDLDLPVILITAFGDEQTLAEASGLDVTAVFNKPFDIDDLRIAVLSLFLDRQRGNRSAKVSSSEHR